MATQAKDQILARQTVEAVIKAIDAYINKQASSGSITISTSPKGEILSPAQEIETILRPYLPVFQHLKIRDLTNPVSLRAIQVQLRQFIQTLPEKTDQEKLQELIDEYREQMKGQAGDPETKITNIQSVIKEQQNQPVQTSDSPDKFLQAQKDILYDLQQLRKLETYVSAITQQSLVDQLSEVFPRTQAESMVNGQAKNLQAVIHNLVIAGPPPQSPDELILRVFNALESNPIFRLADEIPETHSPENASINIKKEIIEGAVESLSQKDTGKPETSAAPPAKTDNWRVRVAQQFSQVIDGKRAPDATQKTFSKIIPSTTPKPPFTNTQTQELRQAFQLIAATPSPEGGLTSTFRSTVKLASQSPKNAVITQIVAQVQDDPSSPNLQPLIQKLAPLLTPNEQSAAAEAMSILQQDRATAKAVKHFETLRDIDPKPVFFANVQEALLQEGVPPEDAAVTARYLQEATQIAALSNTPLPSSPQEAAQSLGDILTVINLKHDPAIKKRLVENPQVIDSFLSETMATAQLSNLKLDFAGEFSPLLQNKALAASLVGLSPDSDDTLIIHHLMARYTGLAPDTSHEELVKASLQQLLTEPTQPREEMSNIVRSIHTQLNQRQHTLSDNLRYVTQNLPQMVESRLHLKQSVRNTARKLLNQLPLGKINHHISQKIITRFFPELQNLPIGKGKSALLEAALKMGGVEGAEAQSALKIFQAINNPLGFLKNAASPALRQSLSKFASVLQKGFAAVTEKLGPLLTKIAGTIRPIIAKTVQAVVQVGAKIGVWIAEVAIPALIASAEVWVPILAIIIVVGVVGLVIYSHARRTKFESAQIVPVAGIGGLGEEGDPVDYTPYEGEYIIIPIAGACWPVGGSITQEDGAAHATMPGASAFDIGGNDGAQVVTPFDGHVIDAGWSNQGYGLYVMLAATGTRTDTGETISFTLIFGHLAEVKVRKDTDIIAGTVIGTVDNTGNSTGPHLHYESKGVSIRSIVPDGANVKLHDGVSGCGS